MYRARGLSYYYKKEYDRAIVDYDQAFQSLSGSWRKNEYTLGNIYRDRGMAYAAKGEYARAIADFDQALAILHNALIFREDDFVRHLYTLRYLALEHNYTTMASSFDQYEFKQKLRK
jgi:tetratricopeptide (TPR) repeat protein